MPKTSGRCALTGAYGPYVSSHLIPKALTRPAEAGLPFLEAGENSRPKRRWDSWFDQQLVTREGEDLLRTIDTWGIKELRQKRLVWSGWGPSRILRDGHVPIPDTPWGLRKVELSDACRLRKFFLSLLWRAAASQRPEFGEVALPDAEISMLRGAITDHVSPPKDLFPITLTQISTRGDVHNQTPIAQEMPILDKSGNTRSFPIFRFYFDGLVVHFHRTKNLDTLPIPKEFIVGIDSILVVNTVTYAASFQFENLRKIILSATKYGR